MGKHGVEGRLSTIRKQKRKKYESARVKEYKSARVEEEVGVSAPLRGAKKEKGLRRVHREHRVRREESGKIRISLS